MTTIKLKNGSGAPTAGDLVQGEPALDLTNKRLYTENASGTVIEVGTNPTSVTTGGLTVDGSIATIQNNSDGTALRLSSTQNNSAHSLTTPFGEVQFYSGDASSPGAGVRASIGGYPFDTAGSGGGVIKLQTSDSTSLKTRLDITNTGDISFYEDTGTTAKFFWDASAESLGIGNSSPSAKVDLVGGDITGGLRISADKTTSAFFAFGADANETRITSTSYGGYKPLTVHTGGSERMRIDSSGNVGIGSGTSYSPLSILNNTDISMGAGATGQFNITGNGYGFGIALDGTGAHLYTNSSSRPLIFAVNEAERVRIDSSGNLLVGTTDTTPGIGDTNAGISMSAANGIIISRANDAPINISRNSSDGALTYFRKDGTTVGSIGSFGGTYVFIGSSGNSNDTYLGFYNGTIRPVNASGTNRDNLIDLGTSSARFDDVYATNGTIQTSDRNEKQDIEVLSDAEQRVAQACKGLLRKFRWKDAVAEKGDDARIHFGIIAQDLQSAFEAEGLDAGDYAMFISSTWYEKEITVDAVEAVYEDVVVTPAQEAGFREVSPEVQAEPAYYDVDGNEIKAAVEYQAAVHEATEAVEEVTEQRLVSEAKEAYTYTDTSEEPKEGYTERTRLGVRYPELLSFIIAAI